MYNWLQDKINKFRRDSDYRKQLIALYKFGTDSTLDYLTDDYTGEQFPYTKNRRAKIVKYRKIIDV